MTHPIRALVALLTAVLLVAAFAGCGGDDAEEPAGGGAGGQQQEADTGKLIERDPANDGKEFTVGSKNFAEQYILGEIYAQALEAAGFTVRKQLDLGSEQIAYRALKGGTINAYPEYSGTALTSFYRVKIEDIPRDPQQSYDQLRELAAEEQITALPQTPFQNTYVVTSTKATAEELGNPKTISELAEAAGSSRSISGFPECRQRTDCLLGIKNVYGWEPRFVSSEGKFEDLDQGQADFTFGFGTDGELSLEKYVTYEDDKALFPPYYVTLLVNEEGMAALGDSGREIVERVQEPLTEEVMQELNSRVTIDKQKPEQVARDYLREAGFTE